MKYNVEYTDSREGVALNSAEFNKSMEIIVEALKERGYDPNAQIRGFLQYDDHSYITRHKNARELIQRLDKDQIRQFLSSIK